MFAEKAENGFIITDENNNKYIFKELNTMIESIKEWYS